MWITQTYLGNPDQDARIFIYWMWEEYAGHAEAPADILKRMQEIGRRFGERVTLMTPQPGEHVRISTEIQHFLWRSLAGKTPGLLLLEKQIQELRPSDNYLFFSMRDKNPDEVTAIFREIEDVCNEILDKNDNAESHNKLIDRIFDAVQIRPAFMGIGIDLKKLLRGR